VTKPTILGFPRSGNTWLYYICGVLLGAKDPNNLEEVGQYIERRHNTHIKGKTIFIVRNYKECIIRHFGIEDIKGRVGDFLSKPTFKGGVFVSLYINILRTFELANHGKLLIYYEDLMTNPEKQIRRVGKFLDVPTEDFINNYEYYKEDSLSNKPYPERKSFTRGEDLTFHSRQLSLKERTIFDNFYERNYTDLFNKYLTRYKENGNT